MGCELDGTESLQEIFQIELCPPYLVFIYLIWFQKIKMKSIFNLLIIFLFSFAFKTFAGTKRIELHLGLNECVTCYAAITNFSSLQTFEKTIVISKQDSAAALEFLENYSLAKDIKYRFDKKVNFAESYCLVFNGELVVDSFSFKKLPSKYISLESSLGSQQRLKLPPSFVVNKTRLDITVTNQGISFFDYILNKAISLNYNQTFDSVTKMTVIKGSTLDRKEFLKKGHLDTVLYNILYPQLKRIGKSDAHIESMFVNDTVMSLLLYFPKLRVSNENINDTIVGFSFFIYDQNLVNGKSKLTFVDTDSFLKLFQSKYFINNGRPIFRSRSGLHIALIEYEKRDQQLKVLSTWIPGDSSYSFEKFDNITIDTKYYVANKVDINIKCNRDFYYNSMLSLIVDVEKDQLIDSDSFKISDFDPFALDLRRINGKVQTLVAKQGTAVELWTLDLSSKKVTDKKALVLPKDCEIYTLKFSSDGKSIICLDNTATSLIKIDLFEN
jgi:hypothetical protein